MVRCICIVFYNSLKTNSKTQTTILNCSLCKCESFPYDVKTERLRVCWKSKQTQALYILQHSFAILLKTPKD